MRGLVGWPLVAVISWLAVAAWMVWMFFFGVPAHGAMLRAAGAAGGKEVKGMRPTMLVVCALAACSTGDPARTGLVPAGRTPPPVAAEDAGVDLAPPADVAPVADLAPAPMPDAAPPVVDGPLVLVDLAPPPPDVQSDLPPGEIECAPPMGVKRGEDCGVRRNLPRGSVRMGGLPCFLCESGAAIFQPPCVLRVPFQDGMRDCRAPVFCVRACEECQPGGPLCEVGL